MSFEPYTIFEESLLDEGLGSVLIVRPASRGMVEVGLFLIDCYCLGVKNAGYFKGMPEEVDRIREKYLARGFNQRRESGAWGRKLVEGALAYASGLGFAPHRDYKKAARALGGINPADCEETFTFGKDGKPLFIAGPDDDRASVARVLSVLEAKLGEDGYHFIVPAELLDRMEGDEPGDEEMVEADGEKWVDMNAGPGNYGDDDPDFSGPVSYVGDSAAAEHPDDCFRTDGTMLAPGEDLKAFAERIAGVFGDVLPQAPVPHREACMAASMFADIAGVLRAAVTAGGAQLSEENSFEFAHVMFNLAQMDADHLGALYEESPVGILGEKGLAVVAMLHKMIAAVGLPPILIVSYEVVPSVIGKPKVLALCSSAG